MHARNSMKQQQELQQLAKLQQQGGGGLGVDQDQLGGGAAGASTQFERLLGVDGELREFEYPRM